MWYLTHGIDNWIIARKKRFVNQYNFTKILVQYMAERPWRPVNTEAGDVNRQNVQIKLQRFSA